MFGRKQRRASFVCLTEQNSISTISDAFSLGCAAANLLIPKQVEKEFKLRSDRANQHAAKAKLNFSKCTLTDDHVIKLIEALSVAPRLGKLELDNNMLTDKSALIMLKLLKGQAKRIRTVPMNERLDASYLGRLSLKGNAIDSVILQNIKLYSDALEYANAQTHIYNTFRAHFAMDAAASGITMHMIETLFEPMLARKPKSTDIVEHFFQYHNKAPTERLTYTEMEQSLLHIMVLDGGLDACTPHQIALVTPSDENDSSTVNGDNSHTHGSAAGSVSGGGVPMGSLADLGVDINYSSKEHTGFMRQVAAATAKHVQDDEIPQLVPEPVTTLNTAANAPVTRKSAASMLFGGTDEQAETDDYYKPAATTASEQLSVLEQSALPAAARKIPAHNATAVGDQPAVIESFPSAIPLPAKPAVPTLSPAISSNAPTPPLNHSHANNNSSHHQNHPLPKGFAEMDTGVAAYGNGISAGSLPPMHLTEEPELDNRSRNRRLESESNPPSPLAPPPPPASLLLETEQESPLNRQMREAGAVHNSISSTIKRLGGRRQTMTAEEAAQAIPSPEGVGFSLGFNERNGVSSPSTSTNGSGSAGSRYHSQSQRYSPSMSTAVTAVANTATAAAMVHSPDGDVSIDSSAVSSPVAASRRRSSVMNGIGMGSNNSTPGSLVITRKKSMSCMVASPNATSITNTNANLAGNAPTTTDLMSSPSVSGSVPVSKSFSSPIMNEDDVSTVTATNKQVQFQEQVLPADVVLQSLENAQELTKLIDGIKSQRQTLRDEGESVLSTIDPVSAHVPAPPPVPVYPSCYDFSNQNICGDDWFIAVDAEEKESVTKSEKNENNEDESDYGEEEDDEKQDPEVSLIFHRVELVPRECFKYIKTLILCHNQIECFNWSVLLGLKSLVELDLSHNYITHIIDSIVFMQTFANESSTDIGSGTTNEETTMQHHKKTQSQKKKVRNSYDSTALGNENDESNTGQVLHRTLKRLDLSHNRIVDSSGLVSLVCLEELNLSHNAIRIPDGIPFSTKRLDLSFNRLASFMALRMLGLCKATVAIDMEGNPITHSAMSSSVSTSTAGSTTKAGLAKQKQAWRDRITSIMPGLKELDGYPLARARERHNKNLAVAEQKVHMKRLLPYQIFNLKQAKKREIAREREKKEQEEAYAAARAAAEAEAAAAAGGAEGGRGDSANQQMLNTSVLSFATTSSTLSRRQSQHQSDLTRSTIYYANKMEVLEAKRAAIKEQFDHMSTKSLHITRAMQREAAKRLSGEHMHVTEYAHHSHQSPYRQQFHASDTTLKNHYHQYQQQPPMHIGMSQFQQPHPNSVSKSMEDLRHSANATRAHQQVLMESSLGLNRSYDHHSEDQDQTQDQTQVSNNRGGSLMTTLFNGPDGEYGDNDDHNADDYGQNNNNNNTDTNNNDSHEHDPLPQDATTAYVLTASTVLHDLVNAIQCEDNNMEAVMNAAFVRSFTEQLRVLDDLRVLIEREGVSDESDGELVQSFHYIFGEVFQVLSNPGAAEGEVVYRYTVQQILEFLMTKTDQGRVVQDAVVQSREPVEPSTGMATTTTSKSEYVDENDENNRSNENQIMTRGSGDDGTKIQAQIQADKEAERQQERERQREVERAKAEAEEDSRRLRLAEAAAVAAAAAEELRVAEEAAAGAEAERIRLVEERLVTAAALTAASEAAKAVAEGAEAEAERIRVEAAAEATRAREVAEQEAESVRLQEEKLVADLTEVMNPKTVTVNAECAVKEDTDVAAVVAVLPFVQQENSAVVTEPESAPESASLQLMLEATPHDPLKLKVTGESESTAAPIAVFTESEPESAIVVAAVETLAITEPQTVVPRPPPPPSVTATEKPEQEQKTDVTVEAAVPTVEAAVPSVVDTKQTDDSGPVVAPATTLLLSLPAPEPILALAAPAPAPASASAATLVGHAPIESDASSFIEPAATVSTASSPTPPLSPSRELVVSVSAAAAAGSASPAPTTGKETAKERLARRIAKMKSKNEESVAVLNTATE